MMLNFLKDAEFMIDSEENDNDQSRDWLGILMALYWSFIINN